MTASLRLRWGGRCVQIRTPRAELLAALAHVYRPFLAGAARLPARPRAGAVTAAVNGRWERYATVDDAVAEIVSAIDELLRPRLSDGLVLHATAVDNADGIVLIVGSSGAGKTTTAMALVQRGWRYVSDEWAVLDGHGRLRPYPRAAALRAPPAPAQAGVRLVIDADWGYRCFLAPPVRAGLGSIPARAVRIVFPEARVDDQPAIETLSAGLAAARLIPSTVEFLARAAILWPRVSDLALASRAWVFRWSDDPRDDGLLDRTLRGEAP